MDKKPDLLHTYYAEVRRHDLIDAKRAVELSEVIRNFLGPIEEFARALPINEREKYYERINKKDDGLKYDAVIQDHRANWDESAIQAYYNSRDELVTANLRLVINLAEKWVGKARREDLINAGNRGLIRASELYDGSKKFSTYATHHIMQQMRRVELSERRKVLYFPSHLQTKLTLMNCAEEYCRTREIPLNLQNLRAFLKTTKKKCKDSDLESMLLAHERNTQAKNSVRAEVHTRKGRTYLNGSTNDDPSKQASFNDAKNKLRELLGTLDETARAVLELRFGLGGREPLSLEAVGEVIGFSRETVRNIQKKSMNELRKHFGDNSGEWI